MTLESVKCKEIFFYNKYELLMWKEGMKNWKLFL